MKQHISARMILRLASANIIYKRSRSIITTIGVVIGVGSVFLLLSFGIGLQQLVEQQIVGNVTIDTIDVTSSNSKVLTLNTDSLKRISDLQHVSSASGVFAEAATVGYNGSSLDLVSYGVDRQYIDLNDFEISAGGLINPDTDEGSIVVNEAMSKAIGIDSPRDAVGQEISFSLLEADGSKFSKTLRIAGVVTSIDTPELFASYKMFQAAHKDTYAQVKVSVDDRGYLSTVRQSIESLGYDTSSPVDTITQINDVFRFFNLVLVALGGIGMIIAVLGMFNTLTVSLLERTREIALMMIVGARPRDIRGLFITEALILSMVGAVVGIIAATGVGLIINGLLNQLAAGRGVSEGFSVFAVSPIVVIGLLLFMAIIGVLVSLNPARRAARVNPVNVLREE